MHGAIGYTLEYDLALYTQRALVMAARYGRSGNLHSPTKFMQPTSNNLSGENQNVSLENYEPQAGDWNKVDDQTFRMVLRQWIKKNYPPQLKHYPGQVRWADIKSWYLALRLVVGLRPLGHWNTGAWHSTLQSYSYTLTKWNVMGSLEHRIKALLWWGRC